MSNKFKAGAPAPVSDAQAPFTLSGTLSSYEVEEVKPQQVARMLADLKRYSLTHELAATRRFLAK